MRRGESENRATFIQVMELAKEEGRLNLVDGVYKLDNVEMDALSGCYLNTEAGNNKSNKRSYAKIAGLMIPDYWFKVVADGLLTDNKEYIDKFICYRNGIKGWGVVEHKKGETIYGPVIKNSVINHIDGNTRNNRSENLEVVTDGMNNAHARLMAEIYYYYDEGLIVDREWNEADKCWMYHYTENSIDCKFIEMWNEQNKNDKSRIIKACRDKNGEFVPHLDRDVIDEILVESHLI